MKLTLDDIADQRAYEREREAFREHVIALKKRRRVGVGPVLTFVFENRDTIRFQIQEMARVERIFTDEGIQAELDVYNPLIPEPGHLAATMFLELTTKDELQEWLPKLVGIERSVELHVGADIVIPGDPDPGHDAQLTRPNTTASVHYLHFTLTPAQIRAFTAGSATLAVNHPDYHHETPLAEATWADLGTDLTGSSTGP